MKRKKIAIAYNLLITRGGTDRVILPLAEMLQADIITTSFEPKLVPQEYQNFRAFPHPLFSKKFLRPLYHLGEISRMICEGIMFTEGVFIFRRMKLEGYDLIISSGEWGKHLSIKVKHHPILHYEHTPPKVLYEFPQEKLPSGLRKIYRIWARFMKKLDKEATEKVDLLLCNSENTKRKLKTYYQREAHVIYPPVDVKKFRLGKSKGYFLSVQRIDLQKRVHLQIEIFRQLPKERLIIVGSAAEERNKVYEKELKRKAPPNVIFVGSVTDEELIKLYSQCKAVIQTSENEDFGIVPVEAAASGKPCLAPNEGGFRETIIHGKTGLLIDPPYLENFVKAISEFSEKDFEPLICRERAYLFSKEAFIAKVREILAKWL